MGHGTRTIAIGVIAAVTVAGGVAYAASTPDPINVCVTKSTGQMRLVASTGQCKSNETLLTWSSQGVPGAPGAPGTNGTDGTDGVSGYETVKNTKSLVGLAASQNLLRADCPAGKKVLGGGGSFALTNGNPAVLVAEADVFQSYPVGDASWEIAFRALDIVDDSLGSVTAYPICATAPGS